MRCGGENDDDSLLLQHLVPSPPTPPPEVAAEGRPSHSGHADVLSPLNSNFSALASPDLLGDILQRLAPPDLARAACVCHLWREIASDREMLELTFRAPWRVRRVLGEPSSPAFWRQTTLDRFAISHRLRRGDTVPGLAIKYSVQVMGIKRLNNMMSDHGIYSRERLLIPISKPELLHDATCYVELDEHAKREVAVLYLEGYPNESHQMNCALTERGKRKYLIR